MKTRLKFFSLPTVLLPCLLAVTSISTQAVDFTGRFSMLATTARDTQDNTLTADQQSLRLMLDETLDKAEWSLHMKMARVHLSDFPFSDTHSSDLFRYEKLSSYWLEENDGNNSTHFGYEIDRAVYKQSFNNTTLTLGRQPIDWGSGRFWQPLNVFGSFAPTDLDTDFKPGIDAARIDWFPSDFSSLTAVYAFSPNDIAAIENNNSAALHYRRQVGEQSELALLAGDIIGNTVFGASYESAWKGMGYRFETAHYSSKTNEDSVFSIAGIDYQFENGTLLTAEWYNNSRGANDITTLTTTNVFTDTLIKYGLQQQLSQNIFGLSLNKDISPLLNAGYTFLASPLKDTDGKLTTSLLHQINLRYSVSNESDLLFSLQTATGRGLSGLQAQSEFGHIPASITVRLRFYF